MCEPSMIVGHDHICFLKTHGKILEDGCVPICASDAEKKCATASCLVVYFGAWHV